MTGWIRAAKRLVDVVIARRRWVASGMALALLCATPASAQPEAYLLWGGVSGCVTFVGCGGTIMRVTTQPPAIVSTAIDAAGEFLASPYLTPDGRFLAWITNAGTAQSARVALRDTATGMTTTFDVPGVSEMVGNPVRPELFLFDFNGPFALGPAGFRRFAGSPCAGSYPISVSGDGRRLLSFCGGDGSLTRLNQTRLVDTDTGQIVATLPPWNHAALNRDGSEVYAVDYVSGTLHLQRWAAATGAVLGDVAIPPAYPGGVAAVSRIAADHRGNRVVVAGPVIHVFDGQTLSVSRSQAVSLFGQVVSVESLAIDEAESLAYTTVRGLTEGSSYMAYEIYDIATLGLRVNVMGARGGGFVPIRRPPPPSALTATVTGSDVGLSWSSGSPPDAVTRYVLEVGSAPGLADIFSGLDVGLQTSFAASGVPPGTYYVRVRAGNYSGLSAPSNEVAVVVP